MPSSATGAWYQSGGPVTPPPLDQITAQHELRQPRLPEEAIWLLAVRRAATLFGVHAGELRSAANLSTLASSVRSKANAQAPAARDLVTALETRAGVLSLATDATASRLATSGAAAGLVERLARESDDVTLIQVLAEATLPAEDAVVARSLSSAAEVQSALAATQWSLIDALHGISDERAERARSILGQLETAAHHDEHAEALAPVLRTAVAAAAGLLADATRPPGPLGTVNGEARGDLGRVVSELTQAAGEHPGATIHVTWDIQP